MAKLIGQWIDESLSAIVEVQAFEIESEDDGVIFGDVCQVVSGMVSR